MGPATERELPSDAELVGRCRAGDQAGWNELVERFSPYVFAILRQAFRLADHDAEEVFQEVFQRVHQNLASLRDDAAVRPWIAQLTRNLAVDRLRISGREQLTDELPESAHVDQTLERLAEAMTVRDALCTLPDPCREILDRFFTHDQSYVTIGGTLGIPPGTVASRISRCLGKLRRVLEGQATGFGDLRGA